jgi:hypothetical protein
VFALHRLPRVLAGVALLAVPALASAPAAQADTSCAPSTLSQPFLPWADPSHYELAPGGDFETRGWALSGGASRASGSEPFAATGKLGAHSLYLPPGGSAQSPGTCVNAAYPTLRFFIAGSGIVSVSVAYGDTVLPAGIVVGTGSWAPGPIAITWSGIPGLASGGSALVSIRLTADLGSAFVDDVFIDPYGRCC